MIAEIAADFRKIAAGRRDHRSGFLHRRASDADHGAAGPGDRNGDALPDAGVRAGHHDPLAGKAERGKIAHRKSPIATGSTSV
jgi:hypothetical protein